MTVVTGPRIDPASFGAPPGVDMRAFVPDLDRHLAACDLALVQGGLSTTAWSWRQRTRPSSISRCRTISSRTSTSHTGSNAYGAGRRMEFARSDPDAIAAAMVEELALPRRPRPVESDGAARAAAMLADLL